MQRKKNIQLLIALLLTLAALAWLGGGSQPDGALGVDKNLFKLDEQQEITDVYLAGPEATQHFHFQDGQWYLNDTLLLDQSMATVFFSVLSQVEIRRPTAASERDSLVALLRSQGVEVVILYGRDTIKHYFSGGNPDLEISWMMDARQPIPYQVHLPGYQSYVAGIYAVPAHDWRSRFIFRTNFALLRELTLATADDTLRLRYRNGFFDISGITADSTAIAGYLEQVAYLQADRYLPPGGEHAADSLYCRQPVLATLTLTASGGSREWVAFRQRPPGKKHLAGKLHDGTWALFSYSRIRGIFRTKQDFADE